MKNINRTILFILTAFLLFSCDEKMNDSVIMTATVTSVGEKIEVEVTESDYASGIFQIIVNENTVFLNSNGSPSSKNDIKPGDSIEITYNGQVMRSYPPQVVALQIKII